MLFVIASDFRNMLSSGECFVLSFIERRLKIVLTNFILGNDVSAMLPTGFGKSVYYAFCHEVGTTLLSNLASHIHH